MKTTSICSVLAIALFASVASANPKAKAEVMFYEGKALMADRQYAAACTKFEESFDLFQSNATLWSLAGCREQNRQLASAHAVWSTLDQRLGSKSDPDSSKLRNDARAAMTRLGPLRSRLTLRVSTTSEVVGLEVVRNTTHVPSVEWNRVQFVDGGDYTIFARAPDRREWSTKLVIRASGDEQIVDIPALVDAAPPKQPEPPAPFAPKPEPDPTPIVVTPPTPPIATKPRSRLPLLLGGTAAAFAVTAIALEVSARGVNRDARAATDRTRQLELIDSANMRRYTAEAFAVGAVVAAAVATYLYIRGREVRVSPIASKQPGVAISVRW